MLFAVLTLVLLLESVHATKSFCEGLCPLLHELYPTFQELETCLINNPEALYMMKEAFLPTLHIRDSQVVIMTVRLRRDSICTSQPQENTSAEKEMTFQWATSPILNFITADELMVLDNIFTDILYSEIIGSILMSRVLLTLNISVPCGTTERDILRSLAMLLSWGKAYAKAQGRPGNFDTADKGYITVWHSYWVTERDDIKLETRLGRNIRIGNIIVAVFSFLNTALLFATLLFGKKFLYYLQQQLTLYTFSSYSVVTFWGAAITLTLVNIFYVSSSINLLSHAHPDLVSCLQSTDNSGCILTMDIFRVELAAFVVKVILFPVTVLAGACVAFQASKDSDLPVPPLLQCLAHCCCCSKLRILRALAFWNIIVFIQWHIGLVSLPVCILTIIDPVHSVSVLAIWVLSVLLITLIFSFMLHKCQLQRRAKCLSVKCCASALAQIGMMLNVLLLLLLLILLYFKVLNTGTNPDSTRGLILSLLPPILLSAMGWMIKTKVFNQNKRRISPSSGSRPDPVEIEGDPDDEEMLKLTDSPVCVD